MYCKNCGKLIAEDGKFCAECGKPIETQKKPGTPIADALILTLKPKFVALPFLISRIPLQIFFTIWCAGFLGGLTNLAFVFIGKAFGMDNTFGLLPFVFWGIAAFIGIPIISLIVTKGTYNNSFYRFYETKLEYSENFLTKELKTINYKRIIEVYLRKGIFQQPYGLGTIFLSTASSNGISDAGITIRNIPNSDQYYHKIKELIEAAQQ